MVDGIPPDQVDPSRMVSVLGLKFDHDQNEFLFSLVSQPNLEYSGFVSPYVMQYKKLLRMLWHNNTTWDDR